MENKINFQYLLENLKNVQEILNNALTEECSLEKYQLTKSASKLINATVETLDSVISK